MQTQFRQPKLDLGRVKRPPHSVGLKWSTTLSSFILALVLVTASSVFAIKLLILSGTRASAPANTAVLTYKNNNLHTGLNPNETILTTSNVNVNQFGKRVAYPVDGQVYAQPLFVPNVTIGGTTYNVVFVATQHDSVYAFDADQSSVTPPLWHTSFLNPPNVTSVSNTDVSCNDTPEMGITSTPVIDSSTGTIYLVTFTKENGNLVYRLHALDITTGTDKPGSPIQIQASISGTGVGSVNGVLTLDPLHERQRAAMVLSNGELYIGFSSFCDNAPYHGWILSYSYNGSTFQQVTAYSDSPNGSGGGIWGSGGAVAADSNGSIYYTSGNGRYDLNTGGTEAGDSFVRLNAQLQLQDYFTPFNQSCLAGADADLGSGGPLILPSQTELIGAGKEGRPYVISTSNMGHYNTIANVCSNQSLTNVDQVLQELPPAAVGGTFSTPAYWNGPNGEYVFFTGTSDHIKAFKLTNGLLSTSPTSQSPENHSFTGGNASISSNGTLPGTGILWFIDPGAKLRAFDASNLATELYDSGMNATRDKLDSYVKFSAATVANGQVFVGTGTTLTIYGLLVIPPPPSATATAPSPSPTTPTPTPPPGSGTLTGGVGTAPANVNLTTVGTTDWAHWGSRSSAFIHKECTIQQISNFTEIGTATVTQFLTNSTGYTWTDGTPTTQGSNSYTGYEVIGTGNGFSIAAPADTTSRTLKVYVGVFKAQGSFTATLSDKSATAYSDSSLSNAGAVSNGVYTLTYQAASANQTIIVTFTEASSFDPSGYVSLQSATLTGGGGIPSGYNNIGISDDSNPGGGDFDGLTRSYSTQALTQVGINAGDNAFAGGLVFTWPNAVGGAPDNYVACGQTIAVTPGPNATTLGFLGAASNGPSSGTATINYTDSSTQTFTLGFTDWRLNGGSASLSFGNTTAITTSYINKPGSKVSNKGYVFYAQVSLQAGKTLRSVTLPAPVSKGQLHIFAIATNMTTGPTLSSLSPTSGVVGTSVTLTGSNFGSTQGSSTVTFGSTTASVSSWSDSSIVVTVPNTLSPGAVNVTVTVGGQTSNSQSFTVTTTTTTSSFNNVGISDDSNPAMANYDGVGFSYSAQALQTAGLTPGQSVTYNGVTFTWPNVPAGVADNYQANGQTISLTPVSGATTLAFLGSASHGPSTGTATITYTDGTTQTFALGFSDWTLNAGSASPAFGNSIVATMAYRNWAGVGPDTVNTYLFYASIALQAGKTVQSVTLPSSVSGELHVFAVATK